MKLVVRETGALLGDQISEASSFLRRLRGLMLTKELPEGHGLLIRPCRSVHMFFMNYPIDVLHLDRHQAVVGIERSLAPGKIGKTFRGTASVVELPAGTVNRAEIEPGQHVDVN